MQDSLKMMDAGGVLFKADNLEAATARVKSLMGGELCLDLSSWRYRRKIEALVEETSIPQTFALSLKAGESPRILPIDLPSKALPLKVKEILDALAGAGKDQGDKRKSRFYDNAEQHATNIGFFSYICSR